MLDTTTSNGIMNIGNTCYLSASLQCLGYCTSFLYPLLAYETDAVKTPVLHELQNMYKVIWIDDKTGNPVTLVNVLGKVVKGQLNMYEQNDAMEFIMILFDLLNQEVGKRLSLEKQNSGIHGYEKLVNLLQTSWINSHHTSYSFLSDIVYGQLVNQTKCSLCGKIEHQGETFCCLSLQVPKADATLTLMSMVEFYFKAEEVKRNCDSCKLHNVEAVNVSRFWRMPSTLIIHLKRFDHLGNKIKTHVSVPFLIDLDDFTIAKTDSKYVLKAIACHTGDMNFGHYYALVRDKTHQWHRIDDMNVTPVEFSQVPTSHFYIMFYEKS